MIRLNGVLPLFWAFACAGPPPPHDPAPSGAEASRTSPTFDPAAFGWRSDTASPRLLEAREEESELERRCGRRDSALESVAQWVADQKSAPDVAAMAYALRREGAPYVWPRAWVLAGTNAREMARERLDEWLASSPSAAGERRCGLVQHDDVVVAVAADVLADLEPLPTTVRAGTWLSVRAALLVPASQVKVVVLGPSGSPFAVPSTRDGAEVRARFRADRPGVWLVQVLATVAGGPRPVVEALVHADVAPERDYTGRPAPGEDDARGGDDANALFAMVNGARAEEGAGRLARDARLDALALEHATAMRDARRIAHDLGAGNPAARVEGAGLRVRAAGENVAHAVDVARAHRALWASPSHRENMLLQRFDALGVGVAKDADGSVWVCEIFAELG